MNSAWENCATCAPSASCRVLMARIILSTHIQECINFRRATRRNLMQQFRARLQNCVISHFARASGKNFARLKQFFEFCAPEAIFRILRARTRSAKNFARPRSRSRKTNFPVWLYCTVAWASKLLRFRSLGSPWLRFLSFGHEPKILYSLYISMFISKI